MNNIFKIVVCGVIKHQDRYLILQRSETDDVLPGIWEFPSGNIEFKEGIAQGLAREISEETGVQLSATEKYPIIGYSEYSSQKGDVYKETIQLNHLINLSQKPKVITSSEHSHFDWATRDDPRMDKFLQEIFEQEDRFLESKNKIRKIMEITQLKNMARQKD